MSAADAAELLARLANRLIVSCQADPDDAFYGPDSMALFARAAVRAGAAGIRANGALDVRAIRRLVSVPIVGIEKVVHEDGAILITPSFDAARRLVEAGADLIALDCTSRGQQTGALDRLRRIRSELGVPALADIATLQEALAAQKAGADAVLSTMRGYTVETAHVRQFEPSFVAELVRELSVPVIAEGRIADADQARAAIRAGAFAVVVGTAITRPTAIARTFTAAVEEEARSRGDEACAIGIDLGGTNTKSAIVCPKGRILASETVPTPARAGRSGLLEHLRSTSHRLLDDARGRGLSPAAIGVATAGWVDPALGSVVYATDNLADWTDAPIAHVLREQSGLPVFVENDANAAAVAEKHFGLAQDADDFVCLTLGTGVGCACYLGGRLHRGAHQMAGAACHIQIEPDGQPCTCGRRGCLEAYTGASALLRYAGRGFASAEQVIAACVAGDATAANAVRTHGRYVSMGCALIVQLMDPELAILTGGLVERNPLLLSTLEQELSTRIDGWARRKVRVRASQLGYWGSVVGAAAIAQAGRRAPKRPPPRSRA